MNKKHLRKKQQCFYCSIVENKQLPPSYEPQVFKSFNIKIIATVPLILHTLRYLQVIKQQTASYSLGT